MGSIIQHRTYGGRIPLIALIGLLTTALLGVVAPSVAAAPSGRPEAQPAEQDQERPQPEQPLTLVTVELAGEWPPASDLSTANASADRRRVAHVQSAVLATLIDVEHRVVSRDVTQPEIQLLIDPSAVDELEDHHLVAAVHQGSAPEAGPRPEAPQRPARERAKPGPADEARTSGGGASTEPATLGAPSTETTFEAAALSTVPANDNFSGTTVSSLPYTDTVDTTAATVESGEPLNCDTVETGATVWYSYQATADGRLSANTFNSNYDTVLAVYTGDTLSTLTQVGCNDDARALQSEVGWSATSGTTYRIQVGGYFGAIGSLAFELETVGAIAGRVVEDGTSTALADICVEAYDGLGDWYGTSITDPNGDYALNLTAGTDYRLYFEDCSQTPSYLSEWYDEKDSLSTSDPVSVTSGATTTINEGLQQGGSIAGKVVQQGTTTGIADMCVEVYDSLENFYGTSTTDLNGDYSVGGLPAGTDYRVNFWDCSMSPSYLSEWYDEKSSLATSNAVAVSVGFTTTINEDLQLGGTIAGRVVENGTTNGLADVCVEIWDGLGAHYVTVLTDLNGDYSAGGLPTGTDYRVSYSDCSAPPAYLPEWYDEKATLNSANPVSVTAGATTTINEDLQLGGTIAGQVVQTGTTTALIDVCVDVYDGLGNWYGSSITDTTGNYSVTPLASGTDYRINFVDCSGSGYGEEWYDEQSSLDTSNAVSVTAGATTTINEDLDPPNLTGTVFEPNGLTTVSGARVEAIIVSGTGFDNSTTSGTDGTYGMALGASTTYEVTAYPPYGSAYDPSATATVVVDSTGATSPSTVNLSLTIRVCPDLAAGFDDGGIVTSESWVECSYGQANAVTEIAPTHMDPSNGTHALMTSGDAALAAGPNDDTGAGRDNGSTARGAYDPSIKQLDITVPTGMNCLSFELVFGSEEYPEFVGSSYNDAFLAELNTSDWIVDGSGVITAPNNFAKDPNGNIISVNSIFFGDVVENNGTEYDGATPLLIVKTPVTAGAHTLYLSIFDAGDHVLDSGAFVDRLQVSNESEGNCLPGATAVPTQTTSVVDFNGDGFEDKAIGAPFEDHQSISDAGHVNVVYGSASGLTSSGAQTLTQADAGGFIETDDRFGYTLSTGDLNGDGFTDLVVGAGEENHGSAHDAGHVHVFYGSASGLTPTGAQTFTQSDAGGFIESGDMFGDSLATGDLNGDGIDDLVVGAPDESHQSISLAGHVHVLYGSVSGITTVGRQTFTQADAGGFIESYDRFGDRVAVDDLNGDGLDDLVVSAPWEDHQSIQDAGHVHVLHGSGSGVTTTGPQTITQGDVGGVIEPHDRFGESLATGDVNGDGTADLAVGAPFEDHQSIINAGHVHVLHGSASGVVTTGAQTFTQADAGGFIEGGDMFANRLTTGDVNGDGSSDLIVGAPAENHQSINRAGHVHVLYGSGSGVTTAGRQTFTQADVGGFIESEDWFGSALATGDLNGDGIADLTVGAMYEDHQSIADAGHVHVLFGATSGVTTTGAQTITQATAGGFIETGDLFGLSLG